MDSLIHLRDQVAGKEGVLTLTDAGDSNSQIKLTSWFQVFERRGSAMKATSDHLKNLFSQALEGGNENTKKTFLDDLDTDLEGRKNKFGTKSFEAFVNRLTALKSQPGVVPRHGTEVIQEAGFAWQNGSMQNKSILSEDSERTSYLVKVPISESHSTPHLERVLTVEKDLHLHRVNIWQP